MKQVLVITLPELIDFSSVSLTVVTEDSLELTMVKEEYIMGHAP